MLAVLVALINAVSLIAPTSSASAAATCGSYCQNISSDRVTLAKQLGSYVANGTFEATQPGGPKNDLYNNEILPVAQSGDAPGCEVDTRVLQTMVIVVKKFGSLKINDLNRKCPTMGHSYPCSEFEGSLHCVNPSLAMDFGAVGGITVNGINNQSHLLLNFLDTFVPTGTTAGQGPCKDTGVQRGWTFTHITKQVADACTHQHFDFSSTNAPLAIGASASGYVISSQVNTGRLWSITNKKAATNYPVGVAAGTSPAIAPLGDGKFVTAFQAAGGALWTIDSAGAATTFPVGMKAGTSPAIIPTSGGGYVVAVQANTGKLWTITNTKAATAFDVGMMAGTDPSITAVGSGYVVAVQTNTGALWSVTNTKAATAFPVGMKAGTSPAITSTANGGYVIAFQTNTGDLWSITNTKAATAFPIGMKAGTSPAILRTTSGYVVAVQTNTGALWTITGDKAATAFPVGMAAGTSPSIAAVGDGYVVAVQTNTNDLWSINDEKAATAFPVGMKAGTSPAILSR